MSEKQKDNIIPFLDGKNISLVLPRKENINLYLKWVNTPEVRRLGRSVLPTIKEDIEKRFEEQDKKVKDSIYFEIYHKKEKKPIGDCGFNRINWIDRRADIGLGIGEPDYWNQGIASEAVGLLLQYGFEQLGLYKITADIFSPNIGSWSCAEKVGMKREAELIRHTYIDGEYVDALIYSIFKNDWINRYKNQH